MHRPILNMFRLCGMVRASFCRRLSLYLLPLLLFSLLLSRDRAEEYYDGRGRQHSTRIDFANSDCAPAELQEPANAMSISARTVAGRRVLIFSYRPLTSCLSSLQISVSIQ